MQPLPADLGPSTSRAQRAPLVTANSDVLRNDGISDGPPSSIMQHGGDELEEFRGADLTADLDHAGITAEVARDLLLFEYASDLYGVEAACVVGVVPWQPPVVVPGADARVSGVIQDRGRIVVVMAHPTAQVGGAPAQDPIRIVMCSTGRGHIGLPASATRNVGRVVLQKEPVALSVYESEFGPFIYLDPSRYGDRNRTASG